MRCLISFLVILSSATGLAGYSTAGRDPTAPPAVTVVFKTRVTCAGARRILIPYALYPKCEMGRTLFWALDAVKPGPQETATVLTALRADPLVFSVGPSRRFARQVGE